MTAPHIAAALMRTYRQGDWVLSASCAQSDPELWFPDKGQNNREAKDICGACDVRKECLEWAVNAPVNLLGIWGGFSETERARIRRNRNIRDIKDFEHGTPAGARAHYRRGEKPCPPCMQAQNLRERERTARKGGKRATG